MFNNRVAFSHFPRLPLLGAMRRSRDALSYVSASRCTIFREETPNGGAGASGEREEIRETKRRFLQGGGGKEGG